MLSIEVSIGETDGVSISVEYGVVLGEEDVTQDPKWTLWSWNVKWHEGTGTVLTEGVDVWLL